jgi:rhodanese-related sulfurtransferase
MPQAAADAVVMLDLRHLTLRTVRARRNPDCGARCSRCSQALAAARAAAAGELEVAYESIDAAVRDGYQVIDIRDANERLSAPLSGPVTAIAMQELLSGRNLPADGRYLFVCARGQRSLAVAQHCRERGLREARSLRGGVAALAPPVLR